MRAAFSPCAAGRAPPLLPCRACSTASAAWGRPRSSKRSTALKGVPGVATPAAGNHLWESGPDDDHRVSPPQ